MKKVFSIMLTVQMTLAMFSTSTIMADTNGTNYSYVEVSGEKMEDLETAEDDSTDENLEGNGLGCNYDTAEVLVQNLAMYTGDNGVSVQQQNFDKQVTGLDAYMPSTGNVNVLVIPVEFNDYKLDDDIEEQLSDLFFGESDEHYPYESLAAYYRRASFDKLHIGGDVIPKIQLQFDRQTYDEDRNLFDDALEQYKQYLLKNYTGNDEVGYLEECLSKYDSNNDGVIDGLYFYYAGGVIDNKSKWWSYVTSSSSAFSIGWDNVQMKIGSTCYIGHEVSARNTVIHETGHMLGLGDYYLNDKSSPSEYGSYSNEMMSENNGDLTAFSKLLLGWIDPENVKIIKEGQDSIELEPSVDDGQCAIIIPKYEEDKGLYTKFFIVDYATYTGNDTSEILTYEKNAGLRVYYVDATLNEEGKDFIHYNNSKDCALCPLIRQIHADGSEQHCSNMGSSNAKNNFIVTITNMYNDSHCNFRNGDKLSPYTIPSSKYITIGNETFSGVTIDNINLDSSRAVFNVEIDSKQDRKVTYTETESNKDTLSSMNRLDVELNFDTDISLAKCSNSMYMGYAALYDTAYLVDDNSSKISNVNILLDKYMSGILKLQTSTNDIVQYNSNYTIVIPKGTLYDASGNDIDEIQIPFSTNVNHKISTILSSDGLHFGYSNKMHINAEHNGIVVDGDYTPENKADYKTSLYLINNDKLGDKISTDIPYISHVGAIWKASDSTWGIVDTLNDYKKNIIYYVDNNGKVISQKTIEGSFVTCNDYKDNIADIVSGNDLYVFVGNQEYKYSLQDPSGNDSRLDNLVYYDENLFIVSFMSGSDYYIFDNGGNYIKKISYIGAEIYKDGDRYLGLNENTLNIYDDEFKLLKSISFDKSYGQLYKLENGYVLKGYHRLLFCDKHFNKVSDEEGIYVSEIYGDDADNIYIVSENGMELFKLDISNDNFDTDSEHTLKTTDEILSEATCQKEGQGVRTTKCSVCGEELSSESYVIPKTEHEEVKDEAVAATCTSEGKTEGSHCKICNTVMVEQKTIPKIAHTPKTESKVITEATALKEGEGVKVTKCSVCGTEISRETYSIPQKASSETGLKKGNDGNWYYYQNGKVNYNFSGLYKYNGTWWYVRNGKIDFSATTLCKYNETWWYVRGGKVDFSITTLCKYNGTWWYVRGGRVDFSTTTLCKYNGTWWYVRSGKIDFSAITLCKYNGTWWYVRSGKIDFSAITLCKYNGTWFYVEQGSVKFKTTLCKYAGTWWYIRNGVLDFNSITLCRYGANWYAVAGGKVAWGYTGNLKYNGLNFHIEKGIVKF